MLGESISPQFTVVNSHSLATYALSQPGRVGQACASSKKHMKPTFHVSRCITWQCNTHQQLASITLTDRGQGITPSLPPREHGQVLNPGHRCLHHWDIIESWFQTICWTSVCCPSISALSDGSPHALYCAAQRMQAIAMLWVYHWHYGPFQYYGPKETRQWGSRPWVWQLWPRGTKIP